MILPAPAPARTARYERDGVIERFNPENEEREVWAEGRWQVIRSYSRLAPNGTGPRAEGAEIGYQAHGRSPSPTL